ncbi:hypothetical protein ACTBNI_004139 [Salmonella enterica subsp. enterica serovar Soerenga]
MNIDKQALREIAAAAVGAHERLSVMPPDGGFLFGVVDGCNSHCINNMQCNSDSCLHYLCFLNP